LPSPGLQEENEGDQRNQEENAGESRKCQKVQQKNKTVASQKVFLVCFRFFIISIPLSFCLFFSLLGIWNAVIPLMHCLQLVPLYFCFLLFSWWHTGLLLHAPV
jgi:hypothetical protein